MYYYTTIGDSCDSGGIRIFGLRDLAPIRNNLIFILVTLCISAQNYFDSHSDGHVFDNLAKFRHPIFVIADRKWKLKSVCYKRTNEHLENTCMQRMSFMKIKK